MNESESNTTGPGRGSSSLEALSRTIDGLEARLESLVARKAGPSPERGSLAGDERSDPSETRMTSEIRERQRTLDRERSRLEARLAARRPAASGGATDKALRDIAESLVGMRADLKRDFSDSLARELAAVREEIASASSERAQPLPGAMREEMLRLADCIERLGAQTSAGADGELATEVRSLRAMLEELAAESRNGLSSVDSPAGEMDAPTLRSEVVGLVRRLDEMKHAMTSLAGSSDGEEIEAQLKNVASALETLAEQVNLDEASIDHRFAEMAQRLDEISRAIVSVGSRSDRSEDAETLARIENRLTGLSSRIDELGEGGGPLDRLADRMTGTAGRMDALAGGDAVGRPLRAARPALGDAGAGRPGGRRSRAGAAPDGNLRQDRLARPRHAGRRARSALRRPRGPHRSPRRRPRRRQREVHRPCGPADGSGRHRGAPARNRRAPRGHADGGTGAGRAERPGGAARRAHRTDRPPVGRRGRRRWSRRGWPRSRNIWRRPTNTSSKPRARPPRPSSRPTAAAAAGRLPRAPARSPSFPSSPRISARSNG